MKHFIPYAAKIAIAASLCTVSTFCNPGEAINTEHKGDIIISATFENQKPTRTSLTTDGKVLWSSSDEIALVTAASKDRFSLVSGSGTKTALFSGTASGRAPFHLLYPYSDECTMSDGKLTFTLPQKQSSYTGTFGQGASPAIASIDNLSAPAQFRNLCGILEINLCGSGTISSLIVSDLSGTSLWGRCELTLDGKQGTDEQTMTLTGGDSTLVLNLIQPVSLDTDSPTAFNVVVPAGSFSRGFSIRAYDTDGNETGFISTNNSAATIRRSHISAMAKTQLKPKMTYLNLATYNVGVFNKSGVNSMDMVAAMMKEWQLDALSLNELDSCNSRSGMKVYQLADFAKAIGGWNYNFGGAISYKSGTYGIGAVTPHKILNRWSVKLPKVDDKEVRALSVIETENFIFCNTHIGLTVNARMKQIDSIASFVADHFTGSSKPVFLCGDMNTEPDSEEFKRLDKNWETLSITSDYTFNTTEPKKCIDYIMLYRNAARCEVERTFVGTSFENGNPKSASDHFPVFVRVYFDMDPRVN